MVSKMPKNEMLGSKLDHHRISTSGQQLGPYDPLKEALQVIKDFKADFRSMLNTVNDEVARTRLENIFGSYITKLEIKIHAFQEEDK